MFRGYLSAGVGILLLACATHLPAQEIVFSDSFDSGNAVGSQPVGWMANETDGSGDRVRIVDKDTVEPASPPFCVELADDSAPGKKANPFFNHRFGPLSQGRLTCHIQIPAARQAPATVELLSRTGAHGEPLFRLAFESNGKFSYNLNPGDAAGKSEATSVAWTPASWQSVEIAWSAGNRITATVDGRTVVEDLPATGSGEPSELKIRAGGASISGQTAYVDDIVIEEIRH